MISKIRERMNSDEGFTLIELLVVVIIIGILAAIAIPTFLGQRERARRGAVQADLRNVAVQAETYFTDNGTYVGFDADELFTNYSASDGVTLTATPANQTATTFCVGGDHAGLPTGEEWSYDSDRDPQLDDASC